MQDSTEMANLIQTNESTANETDFLNLPTRSIPYDSITANHNIANQTGSSVLIEQAENDVNFLPIVNVTDSGVKNKRKKTINTNESQPSAPNPQPEPDEEDDEIVLKYGAKHVVKLFIPVTICLVFVIISLSLIKSYQQSGGAHLIYTPFDESQSTSGGTKLWMSIANASIFIGVVVIMTIVLILLYKFKCYKIIHGWLAFSSLMLLFFFTYMFISELFKQFNLVTDMLTITIFLWNFGVLGMFCIHWKGPLFLQQSFLIFSCIQMALIFIKYLPEWTTWVLLALISVWDLIAVLCPFGPLRILVETARSRNDNLFPAMVYSSTLIYTIFMAKLSEPPVALESSNGTRQIDRTDDYGNINSERNNNLITNRRSNNSSQPAVRSAQNGQPPSANFNQPSENQFQDDDEENGVKLGLGDFIFYSILVGKASILGDWNTVIACFVAILIGLCLTLVLLAVFHKPLPALPISLMFGLIFYFLTNLVVRPFYESLTYKQVFI